jgi:hypothetical protein
MSVELVVVTHGREQRGNDYTSGKKKRRYASNSQTVVNFLTMTFSASVRHAKLALLSFSRVAAARRIPISSPALPPSTRRRNHMPG